jgi:hypothetical protein
MRSKLKQTRLCQGGGEVHKYSGDRIHTTTLLNVIAADIRTLTNRDQRIKIRPKDLLQRDARVLMRAAWCETELH